MSTKAKLASAAASVGVLFLGWHVWWRAMPC